MYDIVIYIINNKSTLYDSMLLLLISVLLSLGSINALIPIIIILILIIAAAGVNRGFNIFNIFGVAQLAGINPGGKSSIAGKSAFHVIMYTHAPMISQRGLGTKAANRVKSRAKRMTYGTKAYIASKVAAHGSGRRAREGEVNQAETRGGQVGTETTQAVTGGRTAVHALQNQGRSGFAVTQSRGSTSSQGGRTPNTFAAPMPASPVVKPKPGTHEAGEGTSKPQRGPIAIPSIPAVNKVGRAARAVAKTADKGASIALAPGAHVRNRVGNRAGKISKAVARGARKVSDVPIVGAPVKAAFVSGAAVKKAAGSEILRSQREGLKRLGNRVTEGQVQNLKPALFLLIPGYYVANHAYKKLVKNNKDRYYAVTGKEPPYPKSAKEKAEFEKNRERFEGVRGSTKEIAERLASEHPHWTDRQIDVAVARELRQKHGALEQVEGFKPPKAQRTFIGAGIAGTYHGLQAAVAGGKGESLQGTRTVGGAKGAWAGFVENAKKGTRETGGRSEVTPSNQAKKQAELQKERQKLQDEREKLHKTESSTGPAAGQSEAMKQYREAVMRQQEKVRALERELSRGKRERASPQSAGVFRSTFNMAIGGSAQSIRLLTGARTESTREVRHANKEVSNAQKELRRAQKAHDSNETPETEAAVAAAATALAAAKANQSAAVSNRNETQYNRLRSRLQEGQQAPFRSSIVDRAVVEQKMRALKKITITGKLSGRLDSELHNTEEVIARQNRLIEQNQNALAGLATNAASVRADHIEFATIAAQHASAVQEHSNSQAALQNAQQKYDMLKRDADANPGSAKSRTAFANASTELGYAQMREDKARVNEKDAFDRYTSAQSKFTDEYGYLKGKATGKSVTPITPEELDKHATDLEIQHTKLERDTEEIQARAKLYEGLKNTIVGNRSLSQAERERLGSEQVSPAFLGGIPGWQDMTAEEKKALSDNFPVYVDHLKERLDNLTSAQEVATEAARATVEGRSEAGDLVNKAQMAANNAGVSNINDLPTEVQRAKFDYDRANSAMDSAAQIREQIASTSTNSKEIDKFLADRSAKVRMAALNSAALKSNNDMVVAKIGTILNMAASDDDSGVRALGVARIRRLKDYGLLDKIKDPADRDKADKIIEKAEEEEKKHSQKK